MKIGVRGIDLIKHFEALRLAAYPDPASGGEPWTIGWGHTGGVKPTDRWTLGQADEQLRRDLMRFEIDVTSLLKRPTRQSEFDALVCFAFNVGADIDADAIAEGLGDSTLLRLHNLGDRLGTAKEFPKWDKAGGGEMRGLLRRRFTEAALYLEDA